MAEALYGINPELIKKARKHIPEDFIAILERAYKNNVDIKFQKQKIARVGERSSF